MVIRTTLTTVNRCLYTFRSVLVSQSSKLPGSTHFCRPGVQVFSQQPTRSAAAVVTGMAARTEQILQYWVGPQPPGSSLYSFDPSKAKMWFQGGPTVDEEICAKFGEDVKAIASGSYDSWLVDSPRSALAGIILMDQFTRNLYRNSPVMYSLDSKAVDWATHVLGDPGFSSLPYVERMWAFYPFMHSEDIKHQEECVRLFEEMADQVKDIPEAKALWEFVVYAGKYAVSHADVVRQWGRFPHRNEILGRQSTPQELEGLAEGKIPKF